MIELKCILNFLITLFNFVTCSNTLVTQEISLLPILYSPFTRYIIFYGHRSV